MHGGIDTSQESDYAARGPKGKIAIEGKLLTLLRNVSHVNTTKIKIIKRPRQDFNKEPLHKIIIQP